MRAMVLDAAQHPLRLDSNRLDPISGAGEVLIRAHAGGVCRTDLHVVDGELTEPSLPPLLPGHEIVGTVEALGPGVQDRHVGERVGVPWRRWS